MRLRPPLLPLPALALLALALLAAPPGARADLTPTASASQADAPGVYVLAPDDQIDIAVQGHEDLKESATILPDGTFNYPVLHTVRAAGLTVNGLTRQISDGLTRSGQVNGPEVTVSLRQSRPRKVSVVGAVKTPGLYDYRTGLRLRDLVLQAGGPAGDPALSSATFLTAEGKSQPVNLRTLLDGSDTAQNLPLAPGDLLSVQARSDVQVQITGEVVKPGAYDVPAEGASVMSLLLLAGGATPHAALTQAQILHGGRVQIVNLRPLLSTLDAPAGRVRLGPGDVLLVPANTARVAVLGEVRAPAAYDIPDGGSLSVTDAVIGAGSVTPDADKKNAVLLRRQPGGRSVQIPVNLEDVLLGKATQDTPMEPGDILYVPSRRSHGFNGGQLLQYLPIIGLLGGRL